jgi:hypothetical protein
LKRNEKIKFGRTGIEEKRRKKQLNYRSIVKKQINEIRNTLEVK